MSKERARFDFVVRDHVQMIHDGKVYGSGTVLRIDSDPTGDRITVHNREARSPIKESIFTRKPDEHMWTRWVYDGLGKIKRRGVDGYELRKK